jgi:hypothetical protein
MGALRIVRLLLLQVFQMSNYLQVVEEAMDLY